MAGLICIQGYVVSNFGLKMIWMKMKLPLLFTALWLGCSATMAQMPGAGSPGGVSTALTKLFDGIPGFSAKAEVQVLDSSKRETTHVPMDFAMLDNKIRVEIDMTQIKSQTVLETEATQLRQMGFSQVISIIRPDKKLIYVIYPDQKSVLTMPMPKADAEAAEKTPKIEKTALGNEIIDGHSCVKNKVIVSDDKGQMLEAITWNAADLKNFPVQIQTKENGNTTVVRYKQIQIVKPAANQFEAPEGYTQYEDMMDLMRGVMKKGPASAPGASPQPQKSAPK
jgi:hypothetical protein